MCIRDSSSKDHALADILALHHGARCQIAHNADLLTDQVFRLEPFCNAGKAVSYTHLHLPEGRREELYYESYVQDCRERRATAASVFQMNNSGFHAEITLEKENLVFFSVPYDDGFTAYVNGQEADIVEVIPTKENVSGISIVSEPSTSIATSPP